MITSSFDHCAPAQLSHRELIQGVAAAPRNRTLIQEFVSRYDPYIRQSVLYGLRRRTPSSRGDLLRPEVDDFVSEVYCRLFQRDGQALRTFQGRHENSILAYLRAVSVSVVRNAFRGAVWKRAAQHRYFSREQEESAGSRFENGLAAATEIETMACRNFEEMIYANLARLFRAKTAPRNFIMFKLRFLYGYRCGEIAHIQAWRLEEKSVRNTLFSMRQRLRQALAPAPEAGRKIFSRQACLGDDDMASYVGGDVYGGDQQRVETHLCCCQDCFERFLTAFNHALARCPQKNRFIQPL